MTTALKRSYRHYGVYLPVEARPVEGHTGNVRVPDGFLLVKYIRYDLFVVQSVASGRLYLNKIRKPDTYNYDLPEELRISTASGAEVELPWDWETTHFNKLSFWQELDEGYYSLFFEYCNGGTLDEFREKYFEKLRPVPEHFIWLVAQRLAEAIRFFNFGAEPGTDDEKAPWDVIYHRDLAPNNICIHYPSRSDASRPPRAGFFENAFPDIVVIDFGLSALESDDDALLRPAIFWDKNEADEWEDIYMMGKILRQLCQTHIPIPIDDDDLNDWGDRPECVRMATVNDYLDAADTRYSNQLIAILEEFEWPNCETQSDVMGTQVRPSGRVVPNHACTPDADWVADVLLPLAKQKVREYRKPRAGYPPEYYRRLDVSWTKPANLMPFVYDFDPAAPEDFASEGESSEGDDEERGDDEESEEEEVHEEEGEVDREDGGESNEDEENGDREGEKEDEDMSDGPPSSPEDPHVCPKPNPETRMRELDTLRRYQHLCPKFRIVSLEYDVPLMREILKPPPPPIPPPLDDDGSDEESESDSESNPDSSEESSDEESEETSSEWEP
ncbi:hypothetical protein DL767_004765 [Monosporascus sp. MG133]|nr:hypothetical protein DL767_004765 [Monosporascus sp. MG133]